MASGSDEKDWGLELKTYTEGFRDDLLKLFEEFKAADDGNTGTTKDKLAKFEAWVNRVRDDLPKEQVAELDKILAAQKPDLGDQKMTTEQKTSIALGGVCAAVGGLVGIFSAMSRKWDMDALIKARTTAAELMEKGDLKGAMKKLEEGKMWMKGVDSENCKDMAKKLKDSKHCDSSQTLANQQNEANWADKIAVAGALVQLGTAGHMLYSSCMLRAGVMGELKTREPDPEKAGDLGSWQYRLTGYQQQLQKIKDEFSDWYDKVKDIVTGDEFNVDADAVVPVATAFANFNSRILTIINGLQTLQMEVRNKYAEVHTAYFASAQFTMTASVGAIVSTAQAFARPNPATIAAAIIGGAAVIVGGASAYVNHLTLGDIAAFDNNVKACLLDAYQFSNQVLKMDKMCQKSHEKYKEMQAKGKSAEKERSERLEAEKLEALEQARKAKEEAEENARKQQEMAEKLARMEALLAAQEKAAEDKAA